MVQTPIQDPSQPLTLEQFLTLPETKPASEYIDGKILQKPIPQGEHSTLQGDLVTAINAVLKPPKVGRAYPELRCSFGGRSIVPDVAVFQWPRIPRQADGRVANRFDLPPDWTFECYIVSGIIYLDFVLYSVLSYRKASSARSLMGILTTGMAQCVPLFLTKTCQLLGV